MDQYDLCTDYGSAHISVDEVEGQHLGLFSVPINAIELHARGIGKPLGMTWLRVRQRMWDIVGQTWIQADCSTSSDPDRFRSTFSRHVRSRRNSCSLSSSDESQGMQTNQTPHRTNLR
jgi:hypothetical protein